MSDPIVQPKIVDFNKLLKRENVVPHDPKQPKEQKSLDHVQEDHELLMAEFDSLKKEFNITRPCDRTYALVLDIPRVVQKRAQERKTPADIYQFTSPYDVTNKDAFVRTKFDQNADLRKLVQGQVAHIAYWKIHPTELNVLPKHVKATTEQKPMDALGTMPQASSSVEEDPEPEILSCSQDPRDFTRELSNLLEGARYVVVADRQVSYRLLQALLLDDGVTRDSFSRKDRRRMFILNTLMIYSVVDILNQRKLASHKLDPAKRLPAEVVKLLQLAFRNVCARDPALLFSVINYVRSGDEQPDNEAV